MQLNHLNLTVANVAAATSLFESYFGFTCTQKKGDNLLNILIAEDGFILTLMSDTFNKDGQNAYPGNFHFGFILKTKEEVNAIYNKLKNGGITLSGEPRKIRNSFGFYFHFNNLFIEVGHYMDNDF